MWRHCRMIPGLLAWATSDASPAKHAQSERACATHAQIGRKSFDAVAGQSVTFDHSGEIGDRSASENADESPRERVSIVAVCAYETLCLTSDLTPVD